MADWQQATHPPTPTLLRLEKLVETSIRAGLLGRCSLPANDSQHLLHYYNMMLFLCNNNKGPYLEVCLHGCGGGCW